VDVDHEADLVRRTKEASRIKKAAAKETLLKEKEERSYDRLFSTEALEEAKQNKADEDDDDFFM